MKSMQVPLIQPMDLPIVHGNRPVEGKMRAKNPHEGVDLRSAAFCNDVDVVPQPGVATEPLATLLRLTRGPVRFSVSARTMTEATSFERNVAPSICIPMPNFVRARNPDLVKAATSVAKLRPMADSEENPDRRLPEQ